jgi:hypothetical protein
LAVGLYRQSEESKDELSRYVFMWWEPLFWYDFVIFPLLEKGHNYNDLKNTDVFEVVDLLFSLARTNEMKNAIQYSHNKKDDPKGAVSGANILDHNGNSIKMKAVNVKQQFEEMGDD